ncbi:MAG: hypothetical protein ACKPKO_43495, partial [Candidatus Fonsibacter sp.]
YFFTQTLPYSTPKLSLATYFLNKLYHIQNPNLALSNILHHTNSAIFNQHICHLQHTSSYKLFHFDHQTFHLQPTSSNKLYHIQPPNLSLSTYFLKQTLPY